MLGKNSLSNLETRSKFLIKELPEKTSFGSASTLLDCQPVRPVDKNRKSRKVPHNTFAKQEEAENLRKGSVAGDRRRQIASP